MDIQDKVVILTGASSGIGLATARRFAREGAKVALVARSEQALLRLAAELPGSLAAPADLGDIDAIPGLVERIHAHYGRIDVLINNAGRAYHVPIARIDIRLYRELLELNVVSVVQLMACVIPILRLHGGGVIVNISSGLSRRIVPGIGPYASTKYALNALTLTARQELAAENIRVGLMIPNRVSNTRFGANAMDAADRPEGWHQDHLGDSPEHVADKILEAVRTEAAETYADSLHPPG